MSTAPTRRFTLAEYLALEEANPEKHEFYNGEIFAMDCLQLLIPFRDIY